MPADSMGAMDDFGRARALMQGILLLAVSAIGLLGLLAFASEGDMGMTAMFGTVTPLAIALGVWLIYRSLKK